MDEKQYQSWWQLHLRAALGETLTAEEDRKYRAGLAELEAKEQSEWMPDPAAARALQTRVKELMTRTAELAQQEDLLRQQTAQLEARYLAVTGERLSLEV